MLFKPETIPTDAIAASPWKVAIIDDDHEVHSVTRLVLNGLTIDGHPLTFISAYSGAEGLELFRQHDDIAMALVDVVMESDHAGLDLIGQIRHELGNHSTRLILRTGQPGQAPEDQVIRRYDINDYKSKTELTAQKLKTVCYAAIRSYRDIITIEEARRAMARVLHSTTCVLRSRTLPRFGSAVLEQSLSLLNLDHSALYLVTREQDLFADQQLRVLAATGDFIACADGDLNPELPVEVTTLIEQALQQQRSITTDEAHVAYYETSDNTISLLYLAHGQPLTTTQQQMLELFSTSATLMFENLTSREDLQATQKELIFVIGEAIEARSKETGAHVRRVSRMCSLLAEAAGCSERYTDTLRHAAPLHDVGKITIPETILHKPGPLDAEEWEMMKTHAQSGHDLLSNSNRSIAKMGARIALSHHERWDGGGYPHGSKGDEIPLEARIMALVDVIDALASRRCYKEPWPRQRILEYLQQQRGLQFDPQLTDLAIACFPQFEAIRQEMPDACDPH
ncbi:MAG: DUF3369 domain-containing protein [Gammaproteobacteria bacterium]|nr:DUF3369 domain-containing protein [Gammaproteobacteria bacterium]